MTNPRYVAKRVGDDYVLVRCDAPSVVARSGAGVASLALLGAGAYRRDLPGALMALGGASLLYYCATGRGVWRLIRYRNRARSGRRDESPSQTEHRDHEDSAQSVQVPADSIEEASMESFPASDPPALSGPGNRR